MARHLPSLRVLRAFEAVARHLSFTRAAIELNLTQTAISHRIKELEGLLSVQLFIRKENRIALTNCGRSYLEAIRPALSQIAVATDSVSLALENQLKVVCLSAFAMKCLMPALPEFQARHPEIELRIAPAIASLRASLDDFDVAIWYGPDDWPSLDAQRLSKEAIFPVCAPSLLANGPPLETPEDLKYYPVIRTMSPFIVDEWPAWLQCTGVQLEEFEREVYCEGVLFSMDATLAGLGIGLGRTSLVQADLAAGRLIEPFRTRLPSDSSYYVVSRPEKTALPKVRTFRAWLLDYFPVSDARQGAAS